jgi:pimeloyl-ACP methyl ester carboxylesterase
MTEWEELTIDAAGLRLAARATGPREGRPVLCLHGWLDNAATFETLAPGLPGLRLVALDLPGHGLSAHREAGNTYAFIDAVAAVAAARDALGWERCALLGHSLGAGIAATLAGAQPSRTTALVLLEGAGPLAEAPEHAAERLGRALDEQRTKLGRRAPVYADAETAAKRLAGSISKISIEAARILCSRGLARVEGGVTWRSDPQVRWQSRTRLVEAQVIAFLRAIACPTLFVRAEDSYFADGALLDARLAAIANLQVATLPGGHHVHLEHPESVAPIVAEFLDRALAS